MLAGISLWQLLIVLLIVALLFGTQKVRNIGSDLGSAMRGFRRALNENDAEDNKETDAGFKAHLENQPDSAGEGHSASIQHSESKQP